MLFIQNKILTKCSMACFLFTSLSAKGLLVAVTANTIQGDKPTFITEIEENMDDFSLFGLNYKDPDTLTTVSYYGSDEITNIGVRGSYPFYNLFSIAPLRQPTKDEYIDINGDILKELVATTPLTMEWFYTDLSGKEVSFTPSTTDTFCSLYS